MNSVRFIRSERLIILLLGVIFATALVLPLLDPIREPDFFWHLKTGEWIWQNKSLPIEDPFAFTIPQEHSSMEHFILTSYWLTQVLYYLIHRAAGFPGIISLRFIIISLLVFVMWRRNRGDRFLNMGLLAAFLVQLLSSVNMDRPQLFSFLFFACLLLLLDRLREPQERAGKKGYWYVPLLMLMWANMHGGFILGMAIILVYLILEGVKFIHPSFEPMKKHAYIGLFVTGLAGVMASFVNPNTYHLLIEFVDMSPTIRADDNVEYLSSLEIFRLFHSNGMILYWGILVLAAVALVLKHKRNDLVEAAIVAGTAIVSFSTVRYIPFFMIAALPLINQVFSQRGIVSRVRLIIVYCSLLSVILMSWDDRSNIKRVVSGRWLDGYLAPEKAAAFVIENQIAGNMYNHYNHGGYLIWRFFPGRKVFIDGRNLYEHIYVHSSIINNADPRDLSGLGLPAWKTVLRYYDINYIVVPLFTHTGQVLPIVPVLAEDREWVPVFIDYSAAIFVKNVAVNAEVIRRYAIAKDNLIANIPH
ncbi:MAG: hypothetical protein HZA17_14900 [Nitrospirae bacterium]|nr:hypothetical protein [Nitrospirota bacterium]